MVGIRVAPDNSDVVVWKLDEATTPFVNSSTSPSAISHANSDLTTLSGTILLQQPSLFAASGTNSCIQLIGNNSGSPRNFISGANNYNPQPPITISCWYYQRAYDTTGFTQHGVTKQSALNTWSGSSFGSIDLAQNRRYASQSNQYDFYFNTGFGLSGADVVTPVDFTIPLNTWCHIGMTYDGTTAFAYINGNSLGSVTASPTGNIVYGGTPGPWFIGAIPSGSGNPEEGQFGMCDVRIANVIRPQSYFQNIYQNGMLNNNSQISVITTFYKMRAFDIFYTSTPVYWTDTVVSYQNAPASPSGLGLGPIEVVQLWNVLNV